MKELDNGQLELSAEDIERTILASGIQFQMMRINVRYKGCRDDEVKQGEGTDLDVTPHTGPTGVALSKVLGYIAYDLKVKGATRVRGDTQSATDANIEGLSGHWKPDLSLITERVRKAEATATTHIEALKKKQRRGELSMAEMAEIRAIYESLYPKE